LLLKLDGELKAAMAVWLPEKEGASIRSDWENDYTGRD